MAKRPALHNPIVTAGLKWPPEMWPTAYAIVKTVKPKARATPTNPIPRWGNPAASTAAPQPPNTSQNVPKNSATTRRDISIPIGCLLRSGLEDRRSPSSCEAHDHRARPDSIRTAARILRLSGLPDRTRLRGFSRLSIRLLKSGPANGWNPSHLRPPMPRLR